ncbi:MAG: UDP-glucose 4-epimerase GalE [Panacagrimonas sp.]
MKTLVIGGAGYIGSHMVRWLKDAAHPVSVFDNLSTGHREAVGHAELIVGDMLDAAALDAAIASSRPDVIMHFAALSIVSDSMREPLAYYRQNIGGTVNLLESMRRHGVRRLVFSSTAALFGHPQVLPIGEDAPLAPINTYGRSKRFAEQVIEDACRAHGLQAAALRYFNAAGAHPSGEIGESHTPETHLIPNLLRAAAGTGPLLTLYGDDHDTADGTCVRDYVHVQDLAQAHQLAAEAMDDPGQPAFQTYNLGNGLGFSVREVLRAAERVVGRPIPHQMAGRRPGDPPSLVASSQRALDVLGWTPRYPDLERIIETAWRWHQAPRFGLP